MPERLAYFGTNNGVISLRRLPGDWDQVALGLYGHQIRALAHKPGHPHELFAGSYGCGLFHSTDAGVSWRACDHGLPYGHVRAILFDPSDSNRIFVGTEPAALFRSVDGGHSWCELTSLRHLPGHERWFLPYAPRAGAVRTLSAVPGLPGTFYGGIEQGGVIYTNDGGDEWQLLGGGVNEDVHQVIVTAGGGSTVYVATGAGVYRSFDGGQNWDRVIEQYTRAIVQQPGHSAIVFAGPALRVGHLGRLERSRDDGSIWTSWSDGLPTPLSGMVEQLATRPGGLDDLGGLVAVLSQGEVYHSDFDCPNWASIICGGMPHVNVVELASD